jgi:tripartite-type tricarboxylate transporter receptor subunit TctC
MAINVSIYKNLPYDPSKDLVPLALIAGVPFMLVVNPDLPVHSVPDLIAAAKSKPGGLSYASNGHGGAAHLFAELLKSTLGIEMIHVPYKGLMPGLTEKDFADRGLVPLNSGSTEELQRFVKSEIVRWGKVVVQAGAAGSQ